MAELSRLEQLLAFSDWEKKNNPPPDGMPHITQWAYEEIIKLKTEASVAQRRYSELFEQYNQTCVDLAKTQADAQRYRALRAECECIDYGDIKDVYLRITGYGNTRTDDLVDSVVDKEVVSEPSSVTANPHKGGTQCK